MTCASCQKYKGCWTDSGVCSDCDEAEDERKMAENNEAESLGLTPGQQSAEARLIERIRAAKSVLNARTAADLNAYETAQAKQDVQEAEQNLADFYQIIRNR